MSKELVVLWVGRHDREPWRSLCGRYQQRVARLLPLRAVQIKVKAPAERQLEAEGEALSRALPKGAWTVALDRRGKEVSSPELSRLLVRQRDNWAGPLVFVVGSDLGLDRPVLDACHFRLSLGRLTLPHELARLVLMEQLYRAFAIDKGIKYHRPPI